jgi:hypothetical protein
LLQQEQLPKAPSQAVTAQLLRLAVQPKSAPSRPWRPSRRLCALLNDLREARAKQADLAAAVRSALPEPWWGADAGGQHILGSRLQLCQVTVPLPFW